MTAAQADLWRAPEPGRTPSLSHLRREVHAFVVDAERHFDMDAAREHVARRGITQAAVRGAVAALVGGYVQEAEDAVFLERLAVGNPLGLLVVRGRQRAAVE